MVLIGPNPFNLFHFILLPSFLAYGSLSDKVTGLLHLLDLIGWYDSSLFVIRAVALVCNHYPIKLLIHMQTLISLSHTNITSSRLLCGTQLLMNCCFSHLCNLFVLLFAYKPLFVHLLIHHTMCSP